MKDKLSEAELSKKFLTPPNFYALVSEELLVNAEQDLLPLAMQGDYQKICQILNLIALATYQKVPLPNKLSNYLCTLLLKISAGGDPRESLGILRRKGEKDTRRTRRKSQNCAFLVKELMKKQGFSLEDAVAQIAQAEHMSEDSVKKAYIKFNKGLELIDGGCLIIPIEK